MAELSTLARPYAKAAFEFAVGKSSLDAWSEQLTTLANVASVDRVIGVLSSPSMTSEQQAQQLLNLCGDDLSADVQNFVKAMAENKRLVLLPFVYEQFEQLKSAREQSVDVVISSAFAMDSDSEQRLAQALKAKLERDVSVRSEIDESLIGGVVVRAGDTVIDGSIKGRLAKLAEAMAA